MDITNIDKTLTSKFNTEKKKADSLDKLEWWQKEEHEISNDNCHKFCRAIMKYLSPMYSLLWTIYHAIICSLLEVKP